MKDRFELNTTKKFLYKYRYPILFILMCILFAAAPYCDDDLRWGSAEGLKRLHKGFEGYGGRYIGYIIILVISRFPLVKSLFMSGVTMGIIFFFEKLSGKKNAFFITVFSIISMPLPMFKDAVSWASGFANYMTSLLFTLIYVYSLYDIIKEQKSRSYIIEKDKLIIYLGFFIMGIINCLIVEHFTVLNIALCFTGIFLSVICKNRLYIKHIIYGIGLLAGSYMMFTNSAYSKIANNKDRYRGVGISSKLYNYKIVCEFGYFESIFLNIVLLAVLYKIGKRYERQFKTWQKKVYAAAVTLIGIYTFTSLVNLVFFGYADRKELPDSIGVHAIMTTIYIFALSAAVLIDAVVSNKMLELSLPICCMLLTSFIFVFLTPVTPRCLAGTYFFELLLIFKLWELIPDELNRKDIIFRKFLISGFAALYICYFIIFCILSESEKKRVEYILNEVANGSTRIEIEHLELEQFVDDITPKSKYEIEGYKTYYNIPSDVEIVIKK